VNSRKDRQRREEMIRHLDRISEAEAASGKFSSVDYLELAAMATYAKQKQAEEQEDDESEQAD